MNIKTFLIGAISVGIIALTGCAARTPDNYGYADDYTGDYVGNHVGEYDANDTVVDRVIR